MFPPFPSYRAPQGPSAQKEVPHGVYPSVGVLQAPHHLLSAGLAVPFVPSKLCAHRTQEMQSMLTALSLLSSHSTSSYNPTITSLLPCPSLPAGTSRIAPHALPMVFTRLLPTQPGQVTPLGAQHIQAAAQWLLVCVSVYLRGCLCAVNTPGRMPWAVPTPPLLQYHALTEDPWATTQGNLSFAVQSEKIIREELPSTGAGAALFSQPFGWCIVPKQYPVLH